MKLSLRWIFDHLESSYSAYSADDIVKKLIASTAEIEHFGPIAYSLADITVAQVTANQEKQTEVFSPETGKKYQLSFRKDAVVDQWYLINTRTTNWVTLREWHADKEGLLPAFAVTPDDQKGGWKKTFEKDDVILEVDNKSITNRPDLWGHRGFARELSVLLHVPLKKESTLLKKVPVLPGTYSEINHHKPFTLEISTASCSQLAVVPIKCSTISASLIAIATRLCRADLKPMNAIVDMTNYVMADMGHPMHAFNGDVFPTKKMIVRNAQLNECLTLLDGTQLQLTPADMVIANEKGALSLAGIKGGLESGIENSTRNILLEAGCFDATTIRLSSARHKLRTDASARFEKTLDTQGNVKAIERFLALCDTYKINYNIEGCLVTAGRKVENYTVTLTHENIERKIGMSIVPEKVIQTLSTLGMQITVDSSAGTTYKIEVPSYRSSKDIRIQEDIIEEVARVIGYDSIDPVLPTFATIPHFHRALYATRKIKSYLAYSMHLSEVENYALFDNTFIKKIDFQIHNPLVLKNPLTEERTTLVTSLIPHLLQNVLQEYEQHEKIGFFEWARIFNKKQDRIEEQKVLAGIVYDKKAVDFYALKKHLETIITLIGHTVVWKQAVNKPWWSASYKLIDAYVDNHYVGTMGQLSEQLASEFTKGQALCFELYLESLLHQKPALRKAEPLLTHQTQSLDISCMIHQSYTTELLTSVIKKVDARIREVTLIDSYYKSEWKDKKSMTFRCTLYGPERVLSKEELEEVLHHVKTVLQSQGAEVR